MVTAHTATPQKLLNHIRAAIDDNKVRTWSYDEDGKFTHTPTQWKDKAYLKPHVVAGEKLQLTISFPPNPGDTVELYAVYHGRFIEMLLAHFDDLFTLGDATAKAVSKRS